MDGIGIRIDERTKSDVRVLEGEANTSDMSKEKVIQWLFVFLL
jgi:hypothetical protein